MATTEMLKWDPKDPSDVADYFFDWDGFLITAENIITATVTVQAVPTGLTKIISDFTDKMVRVRLSGGTVGSVYKVDCLITTDTSQAFEITGILPVVERVR